MERLLKVVVVLGFLVGLGCVGFAEEKNLVKNSSFEEGSEKPEGWSLSGGVGAWENEGHTGKRCISVTGNGTEYNWWSTQDVILRPKKVYRISFWAKGENAAGGCAISGLNVVNRNYSVGNKWQRYTHVFETPERVKDVVLRFGQWHVKGKVLFDDIEIVPVLPIHLRKGKIELGQGERISSNTYIAHPDYRGELTNYSRTLSDWTANMNMGWSMWQDTFVIYKHDIGDISQINGSVALQVGDYSRGSCIISASTDGKNFEKIGEIKENGRFTFPLSEKFFPTNVVYIKIESTGAFWVYDYEYRAGLKGKVDNFEGRTEFAEIIEEDPSLDVVIHSFGQPQKGEPVATFSVCNRYDKARKLSFKFEVCGKGFSKSLRLKEGETAELSIPYEMELKVGEWSIGLSAVDEDSGKRIYYVRSKIIISETIWRSEYDSGAGYGCGRGIVLDKEGNVYITGYSFNGSNLDCITAKFNTNGEIVWVRKYDGGNNDVGYGIGVDIEGNVYVCGSSSNGANDDRLLIKYSSDGKVLWEKREDKGGEEYNFYIAVSPQGFVYVSGPSHITKYDASGNEIWTQKGDWWAAPIGTDSYGNVYVSGRIPGEMMKYDSNGNLLWHQESPFRRGGINYGVIIDVKGNPFVIGWNSPVAEGCMHIVKYKPDGEIEWKKLYGLEDGVNDVPYGSVITPEGEIFVGGQFAGANLIKLNFAGDVVWKKSLDLVPYGLAYDSKGYLYVTGYSGTKIIVLKILAQ